MFRILLMLLMGANPLDLKSQIDFIIHSPNKADSIVQEWVKLGKSAVPPLIDYFNSERTPLFAKKKIAIALGEIADPAAISALKDGLKSASYELRANCARALGEIGSPEALPDLISLLNDPKDTPRGEAAYALGLIGDTTAVPALLKALNDPVFINRAKVIIALGKIGKDDVIPELIKFKDDPQPQVRIALAKSLGKFNKKECIPILKELLKDSVPLVRQESFISLSKISFEEVKPFLKNMFKDPDPLVRKITIKFLKNVNPEISVPLLYEAMKDINPSVREESENIISGMDNKAIPGFKNILKDKSAEYEKKKWAFDYIKKLESLKNVRKILEEIFPEWEEKVITAILEGKLIKGMTPLQAYLSLGKPDRTRKMKKRIEWDYDNIKMTAVFEKNTLIETYLQSQ